MEERPEDLEIKRKRLLFRSKHRGTKEMDILLGGFYEENMHGFREEELAEFEHILEFETICTLGLSAVNQSPKAWYPPFSKRLLRAFGSAEAVHLTNRSTSWPYRRDRGAGRIRCAGFERRGLQSFYFTCVP